MTTTSLAPSTSAEKYQNLLKWSRSNGAIIPNSFIISLGLTGGHCLTTEEIPAGTPIFEIPHKLCITAAVARDALPEVANLSVHAQLCAFLLIERKRDGFWKPYFDVLPEKFSTAVYFHEEELAVLKGTSLYYTIPERLNAWKREYEEVAAVILNSNWYFLSRGEADEG